MSDWQPIETAPKDGRPILIWEPLSDGVRRVLDYAGTDDHRYAIGYWRTWTKEGSWGNRNSAFVNPTHWMPLPDPPSNT